MSGHSVPAIVSLKEGWRREERCGGPIDDSGEGTHSLRERERELHHGEERCLSDLLPVACLSQQQRPLDKLED